MRRRKTYKDIRLEIEELKAEEKKVKGLQRRNDLNSIKYLIRDQGVTPEEVAEIYLELRYELEHPEDPPLGVEPTAIAPELLDEAALDAMVEKIMAARKRA